MHGDFSDFDGDFGDFGGDFGDFGYSGDPKLDGSFRLILNLKKLNGNIDKIHFKMETLKTLLTYWLPRTATLHPLTSKMPIIVFRCILIARDGSFRLILNLKKLNGNIDKIHFKWKHLKLY